LERRHWSWPFLSWASSSPDCFFVRLWPCRPPLVDDRLSPPGGHGLFIVGAKGRDLRNWPKADHGRGRRSAVRRDDLVSQTSSHRRLRVRHCREAQPQPVMPLSNRRFNRLLPALVSLGQPRFPKSLNLQLRV
jgi:hypothetical protein